MDVDSVAERIRDLKIQGASNIAKAALKAYDSAEYKSSAVKKLVAARPTEPMLRNVLKLAETEPVEQILGRLASDYDSLVRFGVSKLRRYDAIYTHCHSSTVMKIIKALRPKVVYVTETRPLYQGRVTAEELASAGIKVKFFVDSAMRLAIKDADVVLLGADAITSEGKVINKIGSELVAETAKDHATPAYVCTHSLKYDPKTEFGFDTEIEKRHAKEVWAKPPRGVEVSNFAFGMINPDLVSAIISELGVLAPETFIGEFNTRWPEL
jgi:ribose 1,5-bisphosphate isomerase